MPNISEKKQLILKSRTCVDNDDLHTNVRHSLDTIKKWVEPLQLHDRKAIIVSAGPSASWHMPRVKMLQEEGYDIYCVKHALPLLKEAGIVPTACIILDPRDVKGKSTHNVVRSTLFDSAPKGTTFLVASMTSVSTVNYLISKGFNVVGWHASVGDIVHKFRDEITNSIIGGSSSAVRGLYLLHGMGYRFLDCVGFDSSIEGEPSDEELLETVDGGRPKYLQLEVCGKKFWSTGELTCQAQDLETIWKVKHIDVLYNFWHGGMVGEVFEHNYAPAKQKTLDTWFEDVL